MKKTCIELTSDGHECVRALENVSKIYAEERSRSEDFFPS